MQKCKACKIDQPYTNYWKNSTYTSGHDSTCISCRKLQKKTYYKENKSTINQKNMEYYSANREKRLKDMREYQISASESIIIRKKKYRKENLLEIRAKEAQKTKKRRKATPKWADNLAIREFYKNCPEGYHVDHIIPLQGKNVCGLHVLENLQYLTAQENLRKGNKW